MGYKYAYYRDYYQIWLVYKWNFEEGNGTPLQYFCLENPMGGRAWWAAVHGIICWFCFFGEFWLVVENEWSVPSLGSCVVLMLFTSLGIYPTPVQSWVGHQELGQAARCREDREGGYQGCTRWCLAWLLKASVSSFIKRANKRWFHQIPVQWIL